MSKSSPEPAQSTGQLGEWSIENWTLIGLFTLLSFLGLAMAIGLLISPTGLKTGIGSSSAVTVPLYILVYSGLGALGYIFTKLMTGLEDFVQWGEIEKLAEMGLRIPAAWLLATGFYLLLTASSSPRTQAGIAFLVGLYINVAMKSLGSLADRLLGRGPSKAPKSSSAKTQESVDRK